MATIAHPPPVYVVSGDGRRRRGPPHLGRGGTQRETAAILSSAMDSIATRIERITGVHVSKDPGR